MGEWRLALSGQLLKLGERYLGLHCIILSGIFYVLQSKKILEAFG